MTQHHLPATMPNKNTLKEITMYDETYLWDENTGLFYNTTGGLQGYKSSYGIYVDYDSSFVVVCLSGSQIGTFEEHDVFEYDPTGEDEITDIYEKAVKCYNSKVDSGKFDEVYIVNVDEEFEAEDSELTCDNPIINFRIDKCYINREEE